MVGDDRVINIVAFGRKVSAFNSCHSRSFSNRHPFEGVCHLRKYYKLVLIMVKEGLSIIITSWFSRPVSMDY